MLCTLCETDNPDDLPECTGCGKILLVQTAPDAYVMLIDGLEETVRDPLESAGGPVQAMGELEGTAIARKDLRIEAEPMMAVERTQLESDPSAQLFWSGGAPDLDLGREAADPERTAAPVDNGLCPWCGAPATGAVCDACGRRRSRFSKPAAQTAVRASRQDDDDQLTCPACYSRVPPGPRCPSCHVPFAPRELS